MKSVTFYVYDENLLHNISSSQSIAMVDRNFNQKGLEGHSELKDIKYIQYDCWCSLHFTIPRKARQVLFNNSKISFTIDKTRY